MHREPRGVLDSLPQLDDAPARVLILLGGAGVGLAGGGRRWWRRWWWRLEPKTATPSKVYDDSLCIARVCLAKHWMVEGSFQKQPHRQFSGTPRQALSQL